MRSAFENLVPDYLDIIDSKQTSVSLDGGQFDALLSVFHCACDNLNLEPQDAPTARTIARTIIEAALSGELDPDELYERALEAVRAS